MGMTTDYTVTPRPIYYADGKKAPDCYTRPPELHDELVDALGEFPLFTYWGPTAAIASSEWIVAATRRLMPRSRPHPRLRPAPRLRPPALRPGLRRRPCGPPARSTPRWRRSSTTPSAPASPRWCSRSTASPTPTSPSTSTGCCAAAGLLEVYTQDGMEYLDPWTSRAFAVADHQVAHVYVDDPADLETVRGLLRRPPRRRPGARPQRAGGVRPRPRALRRPGARRRRRPRGSPTTTGSTTPARPTSPGASRSTASPATTPPSCSSTPRTRRSSSRPGSRSPGRWRGCGTR